MMQEKNKNIVGKKEEVGNGFGIAGFVLGLIGVLTFGGFLILPILGLIFSIIQMRRKLTGLAIAGLILSALGIFTAIMMIVFIAFVFISIASLITNPAYFNSSCLNVDLTIDGINVDSNTVTVTRADSNSNILVTGLRIETYSDELEIASPQDSSLKTGETKVYSLKEDIKETDEVFVYPIIEANGKKEECWLPTTTSS